jgi:hypothetical protein
MRTLIKPYFCFQEVIRRITRWLFKSSRQTIVHSLFSTCRSALLNGDEDLATDTIIKAADILLHDRIFLSPERILKELERIELITNNDPQISPFFQGLIHLVLWKKYHYNTSKEFLRRFYHADLNKFPGIVILAGKGSPLSVTLKNEWAFFISKLLNDFEGIVISGGTDSGIPGLVGEIAAELRAQDKKKFLLAGYFPGKLPGKIKRSTGYDHFISSGKDDFSTEDILNYWVDIFWGEIKPNDILLTGISGGRLSLTEYKTALALGVKVYLLEGSGGSVSRIMNDTYWQVHPGLHIVTEIPDRH